MIIRLTVHPLSTCTTTAHRQRGLLYKICIRERSERDIEEQETFSSSFLFPSVLLATRQQLLFSSAVRCIGQAAAMCFIVRFFIYYWTQDLLLHIRLSLPAAEAAAQGEGGGLKESE